jgi:hypothetical protein
MDHSYLPVMEWLVQTFWKFSTDVILAGCSYLAGDDLVFVSGWSIVFLV